MGRKLGWPVPRFLGGEVGELGPHLEQCGLGQDLPPYQVASWSIQPFGHNRHGPKIGGLSPILEEGVGHHPTQSGLGWGLPPYQVASWSIQPFCYNRHGSKTGPPFGRELGPYLTQSRLGRGLLPCQVSSWSIQPFGHNTPTSQRDRQDRTDRQTERTGQQSDSIGGTVL